MRISRRKFVRTSTGLLSLAALPNILCGGKSISKKPNILFIDTDDQAQWAVGAYGNEDIFTPNMDLLAKEGILFTRAFTTPVCSPSRAMVMTGCYANQVSVSDWISPQETIGMDPDKTTIAEVLRDAGYTTGLIGKWHLGKEKEFHPTRRGFDYFMGFLEGGNKPLNPTLEVNGKNQEVKGFLTDILADDAIKFIGTKRDKPFALFFHNRAPHKRYLPVPDEDIAHYENKKLKVPDLKEYPEINDFTEEQLQKEYREYYASISSVDRNIGRLLAELKDLGIEEKTVVIFIGDNGYNLGRHGLETKGNAIFLGTKKRRPNMFDSSVLVPLIIKWPSVVHPGTVTGAMVSSIDFFPTLMEIAGVKKSQDHTFEGMSMVPLLRGEKPEKWRTEIYGLYDMHHGAEANMRMIRTEKWKLVLHLEEGGENELYNIKNDPDEVKNLYGEKSIIDSQNQLENQLRNWMQRVGAM